MNSGVFRVLNNAGLDDLWILGGTNLGGLGIFNGANLSGLGILDGTNFDDLGIGVCYVFVRFIFGIVSRLRLS